MKKWSRVVLIGYVIVISAVFVALRVFYAPAPQGTVRRDEPAPPPFQEEKLAATAPEPMTSETVSSESISSDPMPSEPMPKATVFTNNFVEVRAAYFYPTSRKFRKVYSGNGQYGVEWDHRMWKKIYAWASSHYFSSSGHTLGDCDHTRITIVPCSLGVKYLYDRRVAQPYLGAGALASYVHIHTDSEYLIRSQTNWCFGGLFTAGCVFKATPSLVIDLFVDYALQHVHMHNTHKKHVITCDLDISGLSAGGGIGYRF